MSEQEPAPLDIGPTGLRGVFSPFRAAGNAGHGPQTGFHLVRRVRFIGMEMSGLDEFEAALNFLHAAISEEVVEEALVETMEPVAEDAQLRVRRANVPSKGPEIGHLADSIRVWKLGFIYEGDIAGLTVAVSYDREHYWGTFLEEGTASMAPWPFLRPAWEYLGPSRRAVFNGILGERLEGLVPGFHAAGGRAAA